MGEAQVMVCLLFFFLFNVSGARQKIPSQPPFSALAFLPRNAGCKNFSWADRHMSNSAYFCHPMKSHSALKILLKSPASEVLARFPKLEGTGIVK